MKDLTQFAFAEAIKDQILSPASSVIAEYLDLNRDALDFADLDAQVTLTVNLHDRQTTT